MSPVRRTDFTRRTQYGGFHLTRSVRFHICAANISLAAQRRAAVGTFFRINQLYRTPGGGVSCAFPIIVCRDPPFEIVGDPGVKRPVTAADDVAVIGL